jgi:hypothetical protein
LLPGNQFDLPRPGGGQRHKQLIGGEYVWDARNTSKEVGATQPRPSRQVIRIQLPINRYGCYSEVGQMEQARVSPGAQRGTYFVDESDLAEPRQAAVHRGAATHVE